jgi:GAF domain-containing protein
MEQRNGRSSARARREPDMATSADLDGLLTQLLETARTVAAADGATLLTRRPDRRLGPSGASGDAAVAFQRAQAELGEGPGVVAAERGIPVLVADLAADPRWDRLLTAVGPGGARAAASVPVRLGGTVAGSLSVLAARPREWAPTEVSALQSLAELAGRLLQTAERLEEIQAEVGQLHRALDSRVLIEQAKGVLLARDSIDQGEAFERLRRQARNGGRRIGEVAAEVVASARNEQSRGRAHAVGMAALRRLLELEQAAAGFAAARTPAEVARAVVDHGIRSLGAQAGVLALVTADGRALELVTSSGYSPEVETPWRRVPLESHAPLVEAAREGANSWLPTATAFRARYPDVALMDSYQARAAIALVIDGRPAGALGFSFARPRTFAGVDRRYIHALASRCAQALERIQLAEEARTARSRLASAQARAITARRRAIAAQANALRAHEQANFLAEVSAVLAGTARVEAVIEQMAWLAVPRLGDWCLVWLQAPDGTVRHQTVAYGDPADAGAPHQAAEHPLLAQPPGTRHSLLVERVDQERPEDLPDGEELLRQLKALDVGSAMRVPLASMTAILGTIVFAAHRPGRYSGADLALAENLARRTALAVERAERNRRLAAITAGPRFRRPHGAG